MQQLRKIVASNLLPEGHPFLKVGVNIDSTVREQINPTIIGRKHLRHKETGEEFRGIAVQKPDGSLLFVWLPNVIDKSIWFPAYELLKKVDGELANRPSVIGEDMRQPRTRKSGELTSFNAVPTGVIDLIPGKAGLLGPYRYGKPKTDGTYCERTAWTISKPETWLGVQEFIARVDEVFRTEPCLKEAYARQNQYINSIPDDWKIEGTNFTTLYVIKDHATAIHKDELDQDGTFGVMATLGDPEQPWQGNEIVWPKYRIGVDYRPGDLLCADVHEFHGNLPLSGGTRVSCVFFVRKNMHKCNASQEVTVDVETTVETEN